MLQWLPHLVRTSRPSCVVRHATIRKYSALSGRVENVSIPCRSNGFITLRLHHPLMTSEPSSPIIIYLPPGPVITVRPTLDVAAALSNAASATVVQVNYRLSKDHQYPNCIHDVLRAYDWVLEHLVPGRAIHRPGRAVQHTTPIAVCGELIGGGLATMLALTECRVKGPRVAAVAANEPIVDWVFPEKDETDDDQDAIDFDGSFGVKPRAAKKSRKIVPSFRACGSNGILDADDLLSARTSLFRKPEDYFDPFASSVLFLRTAGVNIPSPPTPPVLDEFAELARFEREDFHRQQLRLSSIGINTEQDATQGYSDGVIEAVKPTRKTYKRWPSAASGLNIPHLRIGFGDTSPLSDQAVELAMLLRRSIISQRSKAASDEEQAARIREEAFAYAEQKAQLQVTKGIQFWSDKTSSPEVGRVAQWIRQVVG